jgi:hypothetical protein
MPSSEAAFRRRREQGSETPSCVASLETSCFKDPETGECRTTAWTFVGARCLRAKESDAHAALSKFQKTIRPLKRAPTKEL